MHGLVDMTGFFLSSSLICSLVGTVVTLCSQML